MNRVIEFQWNSEEIPDIFEILPVNWQYLQKMSTLK